MGEIEEEEEVLTREEDQWASLEGLLRLQSTAVGHRKVACRIARRVFGGLMSPALPSAWWSGGIVTLPSMVEKEKRD